MAIQLTKGEETGLVTKVMSSVCTHDLFKLPVEYPGEVFKGIGMRSSNP